MRRLARRLFALCSAIPKRTSVTVIDSLPPMDASSAVYPTVRVLDDAIVLAYHLPGCNSSAVVRFSGAADWFYGPPNDEGLHAHPMYRKGVRHYSFHEVGPAKDGVLRWVTTFQDGTLLVRARSVETVCREIGSSPWDAIDSTYGKGSNQVLDHGGSGEAPEVMRVWR